MKHTCCYNTQDSLVLQVNFSSLGNLRTNNTKDLSTEDLFGTRVSVVFLFPGSHTAGADPGFDQGGAQIVTGLKLPFWGLSFVEFWCWGLIFSGQGGGPGPRGPPGSAPVQAHSSKVDAV